MAKNGLLYLAHSKGLSSFDGAQFVHYPATRFPYAENTHISECNNGAIVCEGFNGVVNKLVNDTIQFVQFAQSLYGYKSATVRGTKAYQINIDSLQIIDIDTKTYRNKKISLDNKALINIVHFGIYNDNLIALDSNAKGNIIASFDTYFLHDTNLFLLKKDALTYWNTGKIIHCKRAIFGQINHIQFFRNKIHILSNHGVFRETINGFEHIISNINATAIAGKNSGGYYVSTLKQGLYYFNNEHIRTSVLSNSLVSCLALNGSSIAIGTEAGKLKDFNNSAIKTGTPNLGAIRTAYLTPQLKIICGTHTYINGKPYNFGIKDYFITNSSLVMATNIGIIQYKINNKKEWFDAFFKPHESYNNLFFLPCNIEHTSSIEYDSTGKKIIYNNYSGLFYIDSTGKRNEYPILIAVVSDILFFKNQLLILTKDQGILTLLQGQFKRTYYNIAPATIFAGKVLNNDLYLRTNDGLVQIKNNQSKCFGPQYGVDVNEITDFVVNDSFLYVASSKQIQQIPFFATQNFETPAPTFQLRQAFAGNLPFFHQATLATHRNNIYLPFYLCNHEQDNTVHVSYCINSGDTVHLTSDKRFINFSELQPATYSISLFLFCNKHVVSTKVISFTIQQPLYKRWWFLLLLAAAMAVLLVAYFRHRIHLIKKTNAEKEARLLLEKEVDKSMLTSIRAQMNPHFLYNALNTIQSYIYSNDAESAGVYISKFSAYTRQVLQHSEQTTISIAAEIRSLTNYLDLEKMRFEDTLSYSIDCDKSIQKETAQIPPLLLQPYVENAIKHGLFHKEKNRQLLISFKATTHGIHIAIDDNGIGRSKSEALNNARSPHHKSFSMSANTKRLEILKSYYPHINYKIVDKRNAVGEPTGTTVIIELPSNYQE